MSESDLPKLPAPPVARVPFNVVVMGAAGSGKTTTAMMLAGKLGFVYADGDEFHTQANRDAMDSGVELSDADRRTWLESLRAWMRAENSFGHSTVVSCAVLGRELRSELAGAGGKTVVIHMADGDAAGVEPLAADELGFVVPAGSTAEEAFVAAYTGLAAL